MLRLFITLCFLCLPFGSFAFTDIPAYTLTYKVEYRGTNLGELVISVKNLDDKVLVTGETFPNALASLIGDGKVVEIIEYHKTKNGLSLAKVTEKKGHDLSKISVAEVSPMADRIEFKNGDSYIIKPSDQLDAYTFPFLSLLGLHDSDAGEQEAVVSSKKIRKYIYQKAIKEQVSVPGGDFSALKTVKSRSDGGKSISVWITESEPRYPLKIEVMRKGKREATVSLLSKKG